MQRYSVHNPIFKKELFFLIKNESLKNARFLFAGYPEIEGNYLLSIPNRNCLIELEFSNGLKLDFSYWSPRYFEVRESLISGEKFILYPNKNRLMRVFGMYTQDYVVNDLKATGGIDALKKIIESKEQIQKVLLIKQPIDRIKNYRYSNPLLVNGICLVFNSKKLFIYHPKLTALKFELECKEIENGDYILSSEFYKYGEICNEYIIMNLLIPKIKIDKDWIISREELKVTHIIDVYDIKKIQPNNELIQEIIQDLSIEQLKGHLTFFNRLKNDLISKQYGIAELKFGVTSDSNFKLVTPIDIVEPLAENIMFIDNIIKVIDDIKNFKSF